MTATTALPADLQAWAASLGVLDPEFAVALGPLVREIDHLVQQDDTAKSATGEPDGYDGIGRRGPPHRLLASEWALADVAPTEFLRRAVTGELLYVAPGFRHEQPRGRVVVLADTGPSQLGAARLAQLAALVVLHRRAQSKGGELAMGILGDQPGTWQTGEPITLLPTWLRARRTDEPGADHVRDWLSSISGGTEAWLLTSPGLAHQLDGGVRTFGAREAAWDADGAIAVEVQVGRHRLDLALPRPRLAIRALRGAAFRSTTSDAVPGASAGRLRHPAFTSAKARLLGRGRRADELVTLHVTTQGGGPAKPRVHRLSGPVLAAALVGRRVLALVVAADGEVRPEVVGRAMPELARMATTLVAFGLTNDEVDDIVRGPIEPITWSATDLLARIGGTWWRLGFGREPVRQDAVRAVALGEYPNLPRIAEVFHDIVLVSGRRPQLPVAKTIILGHPGLAAWTDDNLAWTISPTDERITVGQGTRVLGVFHNGSGPALVGLSAAGLIIKVFSPAGETTLTRWSGGSGVPSLHPLHPWLAVPRPDGSIAVVDLRTSELVSRLSVDSEAQ